MSIIVGIHGMGHQLQGEDIVCARWLPALKSGLRRIGVSDFRDADLACAFYGDLFRPRPGFTKSSPELYYDAHDVTDVEKELLMLLWQEAAATDENVPAPDSRAKGGLGGRTPRIVQRALDALSRSKFFAGIAESAFIGNLKQVTGYLNDPAINAAVQERIAQVVKPDTQIIIGHSLGSVIAYEAVANHPEWQIHTFITLGSPLGIRNIIFDKLTPPPQHGIGTRSNAVHWTNIADGGDLVALVKNLSSCFGPTVVDHLIYNGATAHNIEPYLTAEETGKAVSDGLNR